MNLESKTWLQFREESISTVIVLNMVSVHHCGSPGMVRNSKTQMHRVNTAFPAAISMEQNTQCAGAGFSYLLCTPTTFRLHEQEDLSLIKPGTCMGDAGYSWY